MAPRGPRSAGATRSRRPRGLRRLAPPGHRRPCRLLPTGARHPRGLAPGLPAVLMPPWPRPTHGVPS
eukprot:11154501-Lingulodinium_polyedra.AAC.1